MTLFKAKVVRIKPADDTILTMKIRLVGSKPPIWRRMQVPAAFTLGDLHYLIQHVMGWENSHLHVFMVGQRSFAIPMEEEDLELRDEDADSVTLTDVGLATAGAKCFYEYDFGDGWEHEIIVEAATKKQPGHRYPFCEKAVLACPPEDSGGIHRYHELLQILKDPKHPEYKEIREWIGGDIDPKFVDLDKINEALTEGFTT